MNRYPTHLAFDRSKSAIIRFKCRKMAEVRVHYLQDGSISQTILVCPDTVGLDGPRCKLCAAINKPSQPRLVATGWDLRKERWCIYMAPHRVFDEINRKIPAFCMEDFLDGLGPNVIIQRGPSGTEIEVIPESVGHDPTLGEMPPMEDYLAGLQSRSRWARTAKPPEGV